MTMFPQIAVLSGLYAIINTLQVPPIPSMILDLPALLAAVYGLGSHVLLP